MSGRKEMPRRLSPQDIASRSRGHLVRGIRLPTLELLDGRLAFDVADLAALLVAAALFFGGRWVFRRLSPTFEDFL